MTETKTDIVKSPQQTLRDLVNSKESQFAAALPHHVSVKSLMQVALTAIISNQRLMDCTQSSILKSIMDCASYGLIPNSLTKEGYLIPFKKQCQFIIGYKGAVRLARNTGAVSSVDCQPVYEKDKFFYQKGSNPRLDHTPAEGGRGEFKGAYAVVFMVDAPPSFEYWPLADLEYHRDRFAMAKKDGKIVGPWRDDFISMSLKTVLFRSLKYVPSSPALERAVHSAELQEAQWRGEAIDVDYNTGEVVENDPIFEDEKPKDPGDEIINEAEHSYIFEHLIDKAFPESEAVAWAKDQHSVKDLKQLNKKQALELLKIVGVKAKELPESLFKHI